MTVATTPRNRFRIVQDAAARHFGVPKAAMLGEMRWRRGCGRPNPRHVAMLVCEQIVTSNQSAIARQFQLAISSAHKALVRARLLLKEDEAFARAVVEVRRLSEAMMRGEP